MWCTIVHLSSMKVAEQRTKGIRTQEVALWKEEEESGRTEEEAAAATSIYQSHFCLCCLCSNQSYAPSTD